MKRIILTFIFVLILFLYGFSLEKIEKELKLLKFLPEDGILFSHPASIRVDERDNLYVLDSSLNRIVKLNSCGKVIFKIEENFNFRGSKVPLAVDRRGRIYVVDNGNLAIKIFDSKGELLNKFKIPWTSYSMDIDKRGNIYLSIESPDKNDMLVAIFDSEGKYIKSFGQRLILENPDNILELNEINISISRSDEIYVSFFHWPIVRKYSSEGELLTERIIAEIKDYIKPRYTLRDVFENPEFHWNEIINPIMMSSKSSKREDGVFIKLNGPWILYFDNALKLRKDFRGSSREIGIMWEFDLNKNEDKIYGIVPRNGNVIYFSEKLPGGGDNQK